jgi:hypothetical protein
VSLGLGGERYIGTPAWGPPSRQKTFACPRIDRVCADAEMPRDFSGRVVIGRGHEIRAATATRPAVQQLGERLHPLAGRGLLEADTVTGRHIHMSMVHEPVHGGAGQCFGHELVEARGV